MRIVKLMLGEFIDHIKSNLITAILMSVVSLILTVFISVYVFQESKYTPFRDLQINEGFFVAADADRIPFEEYEGIEEVYRTYFERGIGKGNFSKLFFIGYPEWVWKHWRCQLEKGTWFRDAVIERSRKKGHIPVVIGLSGDTYRIGDIIKAYTEINYFEPGAEKTELSLEVIGIAREDAGIIGDDGSYHATAFSYDWMYHTMDEFFPGEGSDGMVVMFPMGAAEQYPQLIFLGSRQAFVKYKPGITEEQRNEMERSFCRLTNGSGIPFEEFDEYSREVLRQTILMYMPFILIGVLILVISVYTLSHLTVARYRRHLAVYTVVGASKLHGFILLLGNSIGTILLSVLLFALEKQIFEIYTKEHGILMMLSDNYVELLSLAYLAFFLFMSSCMYLEFRKKGRGMLLAAHR